MDKNTVEIFKFVPIKSFVHPYFWHKLSELKLDVDRLNDQPKPIFGYYTNNNSQDCLIEVDYTAFNKDVNLSTIGQFPSYGILYNKNTIEDFKNCDKLTLLQTEGNNIWKSIENGEILDNPSLLSRFILLSFADLKKYNYYYWFAFPTLSQPILQTTVKDHGKKITEYFPTNEIDQLNQMYFNNASTQILKSFFLIEKHGDQFKFKSLKDKIDVNNRQGNLIDQNLNAFYVAFSDPCCYETAGWPLRLFTAALLYYCPCLYSKTIKIISVRLKNSCSIENSLIFDVTFPAEEINFSDTKWIGWEPNDQGKLLPKLAAMADTMDPERLAKNSVNLNLKLMKWRLMPNLDLEKISSTRCILMGAGTLGCSVARNLLAWGVTTVTFVDYGKVSYSNPVRQNLFTYDDALNGGKDKAATAAKRLKEICPGISAEGYNLHIPMPGHTIGESMMAKTIETLEKLKKLIENHDAIFLLTDSRESRWLPTLLGACYNKIVINAALGFDSYLVMRHGSRLKCDGNEKEISVVNGLKCIDGNQLGCYFCNDITAPGNSMKDRTLDQQCTVTRPGVSNIAGSLAVELLVSILQHKKRELAPAYVAFGSKCESEARDAIPEDILGIMPHSIRGMLSTFDQILPATQKFTQCIACSEKILNEFNAKGNDFLLKVFESAKYLEDLTGITDLMNAENEVLECGDLDFEFSE